MKLPDGIDNYRRAIIEYKPWYCSFAPSPTATVNISATKREISLELFEVLFWYCLLVRKDLGSREPDQFELVDCSVILSGMITEFKDEESMWLCIDNALLYFTYDDHVALISVLKECARQDVDLLIKSKPNVNKALMNIKTVTFRNGIHAHCVRLNRLIERLNAS